MADGVYGGSAGIGGGTAVASLQHARRSGRPSPLRDHEIGAPGFVAPEDERLDPGSIVWTEFHYVSNDTAGARKLRPSVVIGEIMVSGRRHLMLAPVSRRPPVEIEGLPDRGVAIPDDLKAAAGFRQDPLWVNVSEANCVALPTRRLYPVVDPTGAVRWSGGSLPKAFVRDALWKQMVRHDGEEAVRACGRKTLQVRLFPPDTVTRGVDLLAPDPQRRGEDKHASASTTLAGRAEINRMPARRQEAYTR